MGKLFLRASASASLLAIAAIVAAALIALSSLRAPATRANPTNVYVINQNVANFLNNGTPVDFMSAAGRAAITPNQLSIFQTGSAGQIEINPSLAPVAGWPHGGPVLILVQTDSSDLFLLNGRGLGCTPACDGATMTTPDPTDHVVVYTVTDTGTHRVGDTLPVTAAQDGVTLDTETIEFVGQAHDAQLAVTKSTIQEDLAACALSDDSSNPARGAASMTYTDINGTALAGYMTTWQSSSTANMLVAAGTTTSYASHAGATPSAANVYCGVAAGSATLTAATGAGAIAGIVNEVTRSADITIEGLATDTPTFTPTAVNTPTPTATPTPSSNAIRVITRVRDRLCARFGPNSPPCKALDRILKRLTGD